MNLLCVIRYVEPVGPYNIIVPGDELSAGIVQLPGDLDQPGPVVEICYRGRFIVRYARSFGIEYQVHVNRVKPSQDGKNQRFWGHFAGSHAAKSCGQTVLFHGRKSTGTTSQFDTIVFLLDNLLDWHRN